jgi:hypothetical protein
VEDNKSQGNREGQQRDRIVQIIVETPRGCRNKYKYDEKTGRLKLSKVMPEGMMFPYDFRLLPQCCLKKPRNFKTWPNHHAPPARLTPASSGKLPKNVVQLTDNRVLRGLLSKRSKGSRRCEPMMAVWSGFHCDRGLQI